MKVELKIQEVGEKRKKFETRREVLMFSGTEMFFRHNLRKQSKGCFGQSYAQKAIKDWKMKKIKTNAFDKYSNFGINFLEWPHPKQKKNKIKIIKKN